MRRASLARAFSVLSFAIAVSSTVPAFAQGSAATAEHLFNEGLAAMKRNDYVAACDAFAGSNEAEESPGTQINLAVCHEKQGKLASAWSWYLKAAPLANRKGQKERAELARNEAARLEPLLHKLVIVVKTPVEGMTVTRDGVKVPSAVLGREDPVDPGEHVIEVTAPKKKPGKQRVTTGTGPGVDRVEIAPLEDAPVDVVVPPPGGGVVAPPPAQGGSDGTTQRVIGIIAASAGILCGVPVGIFAAAAASEDKESTTNSQKASSARTEANGLQGAAKAQKLAEADIFQRSAVSKHDAAKSNQAGAIAFGVVGGVLLIGGIVLILTAPSGKSSASLVEKPAVRPMPLIGAGTYGFGLGGTF